MRPRIHFIIAGAVLAAIPLVLATPPAAAIGCPTQCKCTTSCDQQCFIPPPSQDPVYITCGEYGVCAGTCGDECYNLSCTTTINGTSSGDTLNGTSARECIYGNGGADTINGDAGDDRIYAGAGNDTVYGGSGNDCIWGEDGDDNLDGETGYDFADGGAGYDTCYAESTVNCP